MFSSDLHTSFYYIIQGLFKSMISFPTGKKSGDPINSIE